MHLDDPPALGEPYAQSAPGGRAGKEWVEQVASHVFVEAGAIVVDFDVGQTAAWVILNS